MKNLAVYSAILPLCLDLQSEIASVYTQQFRLKQPPRVCFVGRFKTGKSRLINSLIGDDVLPCHTDECTAQLIEIAYGVQNTASRLLSFDLEAAEQQIEISQFNSWVDLTTMSEVEKEKVAAASFRRYINNSLLKSVSFLDTPGFDGPNPDTRKRAELVREYAIEASDLCVLVLSSGLGEDDLRCAQTIRQHGKDMIVVLNQSDKFDGEVRSEMKEQIVSDLNREIGSVPPFYACSALWQSGSDEERAVIDDWRDKYADDEDQSQWHQWGPLVARLRRPLRGEKHVELLKTICRVYELAASVHKQYDINQQAASMFLERLPLWQSMMTTLIGQTVLKIAIDAVNNDRSLPWKRLQNFGITPEVVAPKDILPWSDLKRLLDCYENVLEELVHLALGNPSTKMHLFLKSNLTEFITLGRRIDLVSASKVASLSRCVNEMEWFSLPLQDDFSYLSALVALRTRWESSSDKSINDCDYVRQQLAMALV